MYNNNGNLRSDQHKKHAVDNGESLYYPFEATEEIKTQPEKKINIGREKPNNLKYEKTIFQNSVTYISIVFTLASIFFFLMFKDVKDNGLLVASVIAVFILCAFSMNMIYNLTKLSLSKPNSNHFEKNKATSSPSTKAFTSQSSNTQRW